MSAKPCKDCLAEGVATKRPTVPGAPGPRCATHHRRERVRVARRAAERRVEAAFEMPPALYDTLYAAQGGRCWICRIATGKAKRLAVDHDHNCTAGHPPEMGCPQCWRGLLCGRCNQLVAWFTPEQLLRAIRYLANPPARRILELEAAT